MMRIVKVNRKWDHLRLAVENFTKQEILSDVKFIHRSLPEIDISDVDLSTNLYGKTQPLPLLFNAMTGGFREAKQVNYKLALTAKKFGFPMAVGSQKVALENTYAEDSFKVVREAYPRGFILANIGAYASPEMAAKACEMIAADAVQIHLNVPQELAMKEGDRHFSGYLNNILKIREAINLPVVIKESGFGIKRQELETFSDLGIDGVDISGNSGTNFVHLENQRFQNHTSFAVQNWGQSTGEALLEASGFGFHKLDFIASGGFAHPIDLAKALAFGVKSIGLAAYPVYLLWNYGEKKLISEIENIIVELKKVFLALGAKHISDLSCKPLVLKGKLLEYANQRGINASGFARRNG